MEWVSFHAKLSSQFEICSCEEIWKEDGNSQPTKKHGYKLVFKVCTSNMTIELIYRFAKNFSYEWCFANGYWSICFQFLVLSRLLLHFFKYLRGKPLLPKFLTSTQMSLSKDLTLFGLGWDIFIPPISLFTTYQEILLVST